MKAVRIAGSALMVAVLLLPVVASAQNPLNTSTSSSQPPIVINSCGPILTNNSPANPLSQWVPASASAGMNIQFTNESGKTADLINFQVQSNGVQFVIRDVGTFSPGVTIDHHYRNGAGQGFVLPAFIPPNVKCSVASVRFTDQSVWPASVGQATAGAATLSASPTSVAVAHTADSALLMVSTTASVAGFKETDNCDGVAQVLVSATAQASVVYTIKPVAPGTCTTHITDETGETIAVPITVQ